MHRVKIRFKSLLDNSVPWRKNKDYIDLGNSLTRSEYKFIKLDQRELGMHQPLEIVFNN